jgi:isopenicillin N synthase-like dioxygenase
MSREVITVDISEFAARKQEVAAQLFHAASNVGFFYVTGHGCAHAPAVAADTVVRGCSRCRRGRH